jgi:hypothetical protein
LETNQRLRRTSDNTLLFITSFLKRRSNCSGDSPGLASTFGNLNHLLLFIDYCQTFSVQNAAGSSFAAHPQTASKRPFAALVFN